MSTAQAVHDTGAEFVFSNGHGLATFTEWFDDLARLDRVEWSIVYERYWNDTVDDMDRQRRKQAEFLVHRFCNWSVIQEIGVIDQAMKIKVEEIFTHCGTELNKPVVVRRDWYYY